jgi:hypothetical protein
VGDEYFQDAPDAAPFVGAGVEFSVGIGSRTAFTEAVIRVGVDNVLLVDGRQIAPPRPYVFASFQDNGFETQLAKAQSRKGSGRAAANNDHDWPLADIDQWFSVLNDVSRRFIHKNLDLHIHLDMLAPSVDGLAGFAENDFLALTYSKIGKNVFPKVLFFHRHFGRKYVLLIERQLGTIR